MPHQRVQAKVILPLKVPGKVILLQADPAAAAVPAIVHQVHPQVVDLRQKDRAVVVDHEVPGHQGVRTVVQKVPEVVKSQDK